VTKRRASVNPTPTVPFVDRRAHERIDDMDGILREHTTLLKDMCDSIKTISINMKPVTRTLSALSSLQKFVIWLSPIILIGIAIWTLYEQIIHHESH